jgi:hypothetical protein
VAVVSVYVAPEEKFASATELAAGIVPEQTFPVAVPGQDAQFANEYPVAAVAVLVNAAPEE